MDSSDDPYEFHADFEEEVHQCCHTSTPLVSNAKCNKIIKNIVNTIQCILIVILSNQLSFC